MTEANKPVSVMDFGAKNDGKTDNWKALTKAFRSGKKLQWPPGVYRVSRTIDSRKKRKNP